MGWRIGVVTSGGDAPGMNACVRAIVKDARRYRDQDIQIVGIREGFLGLVRDRRQEPADFVLLTRADVADIIDKSGTFLKTARDSQVFRHLFSIPAVQRAKLKAEDLLRTARGRTLIGQLARRALRRNRVDALILIGGDTTCLAAAIVSDAYRRSLPIVVVPATIDNDVRGTDQTLGFESAVAEAVRAVDAVRASAASHNRIFVIEVMGRRHGYIALAVGLACGAEETLVPEMDWGRAELDSLVRRLKAARTKGRQNAIIIVAEGVDPKRWDVPQELRKSPGQALRFAIEKRVTDWEVRVSILGHIQRGAPPTPYTRSLASRLGMEALASVTEALKRGHRKEPVLLGVLSRDAVKEFSIRVPMVKESTKDIRALTRLVERLAY